MKSKKLKLPKLTYAEEQLNMFWSVHLSHCLSFDVKHKSKWTLEKSVNNLVPLIIDDAYKAGLQKAIELKQKRNGDKVVPIILTLTK